MDTLGIGLKASLRNGSQGSLGTVGAYRAACEPRDADTQAPCCRYVPCWTAFPNTHLRPALVPATCAFSQHHTLRMSEDVSFQRPLGAVHRCLQRAQLANCACSGKPCEFSSQCPIGAVHRCLQCKQLAYFACLGTSEDFSSQRLVGTVRRFLQHAQLASGA